jgi:uncharacterized protein Smg (DUF494 family)
VTEGTMSNKETTIYEHRDYQGRSQKLSPGKYDIHDLFIGNDSLSSLKILMGVGVALCEHTNFVGGEKKFDKDTPQVGDDFNDKTPSTLVKAVEGISDCVEFSVSFCFVFGITGKICKNGMLSLKGNCLGIPINETDLDLRKKEYSTKFNAAAEELKVEFYLKDSCLWTKGYLDGWFHEKHEWDEKIVDFDEKFNDIKSLTLDSHTKLIYEKLIEYDCADEAAKFIKANIPGVTDKVLAVALKNAGYGPDEIGNALQKVGCVPDEITSSLRRAGCSASETAKYMKEFIPNMTGEVMASMLKDKGYGLNEVGTALKEMGYGIDTVVSALRKEGYNASEAAKFMKDFIPKITGDNLAVALKNAGYGLNDIGNALNNSHDYAPEVLDKILKGAGYTGEQIENSFKEMGGKFADFGKGLIDKVKLPYN